MNYFPPNHTSPLSLLSLVEADTGAKFRGPISTNGGEYDGPCPLCEGDDDCFNVWPNHSSGKARFWCRRCGVHGDVADYLHLVHGMSIRSALKAAGVETLGQGEHKRRGVEPPPELWQKRAGDFVSYAQTQLWSEVGQRGLDYLHQERGLKDETIRHFGLGFYPRGKKRGWHHDPNVARWGLGEDRKSISLPPGIVLPCQAQGQLWYVKVRCPRVDERTGKLDTFAQYVGYVRSWMDKRTGKRISPKYQSVTGGQGKALFGIGDWVRDGRPLLLCEGEFDAMLAWQELRDLVDVATFGGASVGNGGIPGRWHEPMSAYSLMLVAYDVDANAAGDQGAAAVMGQFDEAVRAKVPMGGDLTGYWKCSGDLRLWLQGTLAALGAHQEAVHTRTLVVSFHRPEIARAISGD